MINPNVFRAYDIRGSTPENINAELAYKVGYCYTKKHIEDENKIICVGRDGRLTSGKLFEGLAHGIIDAGGIVSSIGVVPTPMLYFTDVKVAPAASIMITGSHNPKYDNGFKMLSAGKSFFGEQIQELLKEINDTDWNSIVSISKSGGRDIVMQTKIDPLYLNEILNKIDIDPELKICWDPSNGAACDILKSLCAILPNKNIIINGKMDGNFPNHHPDPTVPANLEQLIKRVKFENCDCGIAFDGDADRIGVVTKAGKIVWGDQLLSLFAQDILQNIPNATIIADVKASQIVFDIVKQKGGTPLMWKTGHALIKTKMQEVGAMLAGEMSGHIFFADRYHGYDDAIYAALRLLELLSKHNISLDEMIDSLPKIYNTPEVRIHIATNNKFAIIEQIQNHLCEQKIEFIDIDGLRVTNEDGWWLLRASNTEEAIIARCESNTIDGLKRLELNLKAIMLKHAKVSL